MVFRGGFGAKKIFGLVSARRNVSKSIKLAFFAVKYLIRIIQQWILGQFTHQHLQFSERLTHFLLIHVARRNQAYYLTLSIAVE